MNITSFASGPFQTNAYVVSCPETLEAAIIDPAPESATSIIQYITEHKLIPTKILLTHSHWDHIADAALLKKGYELPLYVHAFDALNMEQPGSDGLPLFFKIEGVKPDHLIKENDLIAIGNCTLKVIETPGHTPGGVCFYDEKRNILISGDTLFKGSIGNLSFPTARPHLMWSSLEKLARLPKETKVYPGHGPATTIGREDWLDRAQELFE